MPDSLRALCVLAVMPLLAGCGGGGSTSAPPTAISAPSPTSLSATPSPRSPLGGSCRPANTDGNGGPYPAASSSDCTGSMRVEVDLIADPKLTGGFSPSNITIAKGAMVTWVWKTGGHNLHPFHDGIEDTGYIFSKTFSTIGDFSYECQVHPGQIGIVHVR